MDRSRGLVPAGIAARCGLTPCGGREFLGRERLLSRHGIQEQSNFDLMVS
jgi:hypothetical protein